MNVLVPILVIVGIASASILALLVIVITGIHASERRMNLSREPRTWSERVTRQMLGAHSEVRKNSTPSYESSRRQLITSSVSEHRARNWLSDVKRHIGCVNARR
jgi:hypothetical protein